MKILCKNKHWFLNEDYNLDKILYLLIDRPSEINYYNDFVWQNKKNQWHRDYDLPAYIDIDYINFYWYKNNYFNRENKPAVILVNGVKKYY